MADKSGPKYKQEIQQVGVLWPCMLTSHDCLVTDLTREKKINSFRVTCSPRIVQNANCPALLFVSAVIKLLHSVHCSWKVQCSQSEALEPLDASRKHGQNVCCVLFDRFCWYP